MKFSTGGDEWYPVFSLDDPADSSYPEFEISDDEVAEIRKIFSDFGRVQLRLAVLGGHVEQYCFVAIALQNGNLAFSDRFTSFNDALEWQQWKVEESLEPLAILNLKTFEAWISGECNNDFWVESQLKLITGGDLTVVDTFAVP